MQIIRARNVCDALPMGIDLLRKFGRKEPSRAGEVVVAPWPVMTVTARPQERVLFSKSRNANPFFHIFEAFWMLAGRDDGVSLNAFIKGFSTRYGEDDGTIHGAYGRRWRSVFGLDQLGIIVDKLRREPTTRQCVIQMWDCYGCSDLDGTWKDRPCNTHVYLRILNNRLDLTVCSRSNDAIWGAHGANAVHFSILQEYLAARIGIKVGMMYQLSNNYHAYLSELQRFDLPPIDNRYSSKVKPQAMFEKPEVIDRDIQQFMDCYEARQFPQNNFINPWFNEVLAVMMLAHHRYKMGDKAQAVWWAEQITAPDWKLACTEWLQRHGGS